MTLKRLENKLEKISKKTINVNIIIELSERECGQKLGLK